MKKFENFFHRDLETFQFVSSYWEQHVEQFRDIDVNSTQFRDIFDKLTQTGYNKGEIKRTQEYMRRAQE